MPQGEEKYEVEEVLAEGGRTQVLRAIRVEDARPVILKVLRTRSRPSDAERLRHEYTVGRALAGPAVVTPLAMETYQGMPALVLEDFGGRSLESVLDKSPMPLERFLPIAIGIADAVVAVHEGGVVHNDLKPDNVLVSPLTGEVKVTDFGVASHVSREPLPARHPRLIEGTLPYISPEQTGRISGGLDERSDLYALGVIYYRMVTGKFPFDAKDPLEWIHCHVARAPTPPTEHAPLLPHQIVALILKLLSKMPDDRYQSARGLAFDLRRCLESFRERGQVPSFPLGERDLTWRLQIPQRLYGRDGELAELLQAFQRVVDSATPELMLVSGYAGIGKSVLVHALDEPIVRARGFFLSGKFDQYKRDIPYATIVEAFRDLVLEILAGTEEEIAAWRRKISTALGANGQLIIDVIRPVQLIIGNQPPVPELPPAEAQSRFRMVMSQFVAVFAQPEHPLVLFLDDLQWADPASLTLLVELLANSERRRLLILGAYRDNEVDVSHAAMHAIAEIERSGTRVGRIHLGPLTRENVVDLLADTLRCERAAVGRLAELLLQKTDGNPFFLLQLLRSLYDDGLLALDLERGAWGWSIDEIEAIGITDNVIDLMSDKIRRLPESSQRVLELAACIGNTFELEMLSIVSQDSPRVVGGYLWPAVRERLVVPLAESYRVPREEPGATGPPGDDPPALADGGATPEERREVRYRFLHDRVQQATYALIPLDERRATHRKIGRLLLARNERLEEDLFDVVGHLNIGRELEMAPEERIALALLNHRAAKKAKASMALTAANKHLAIALELLPEKRWETHYELTRDLYRELGESEYLLGGYERSDELLTEAVSRGRTPMDRAMALETKMRLYLTQGPLDSRTKAVSTGLAALEVLGCALPMTPEARKQRLAEERAALAERLAPLDISALAELPPLSDPEIVLVMAIFVTMYGAAFIIGDFDLHSLCACEMVRMSLDHGNSAASAFGYTMYGTLLSAHGERRRGYEFGKLGLVLHERYPDPVTLPKIRNIFAHCINPFINHLETNLPHYRTTYERCLESGDLLYGLWAVYYILWTELAKGDSPEQIYEGSAPYMTFVERTGDVNMLLSVRCARQVAQCLRGLTTSPGSLDGDGFDEAAMLRQFQATQFALGQCWHAILREVVDVTFERHREAVESAEVAEATLSSVYSLFNAPTHYFYSSLAMTAAWAEASEERREVYRARLAQNSDELRRLADDCRDNYRHCYELVEAERARIASITTRAAELYDQAAKSAEESRFGHHQALALELAARFYLSQGRQRLAQSYMSDARDAYARWGADGKVRQLELRYPGLFEPRAGAALSTMAIRVEQLDLLSVTKASQTISGEIVLDRLIATLLNIAVEQGGAQRGCLILCDAAGLLIEADTAPRGPGEASSVLDSEPVERSLRVPRSLVHYVRRTRERAILVNAESDLGRFAADESYFRRARPKSVLCLPILRQAEVIGLLYLENALVAGAFTPDRLAALELLATQAAISIENALLLAKERAARAAAERAEQRSSFLADVGMLLSESLELELTLASVARLCVRSLATYCLLDVLEGDRLRRVAAAHADPEKEALVLELEQHYAPELLSPQPASRVLVAGTPLLIPEFTDADAVRFGVDERHVEIIRTLGPRSLLAVPLASRGEILGVLTLGTVDPVRRYGPADLELAGELARRAAMAIDNARLYREAQRAVRVRSEFLTVASHELNTPVASLLLSAEILRRTSSKAAVNPAALERKVENVYRQASRLQRLVGTLLDVSRIDSGRLPLVRTEVDLDQLVREIVDRFEVDLVRAGCPVTIRGGSGLLGYWDRSRIDQVITNLLVNAIKFGQGHPIEIEVRVERGVATIAIVDHGMGIEPDQLDRIFGRFERAVSERQYGGLGLGLYISRNIVEEHGGTIRCESRRGEGSTFVVSLPCAEEEVGVDLEAGQELTALASQDPRARLN